MKEKCLRFRFTIQNDMEVLVYHNSNMRTRLVIPTSLRQRVKLILYAEGSSKREEEGSGARVLPWHEHGLEVLH